MMEFHIWVVEMTPKCEWQQMLPGLNGNLWGHCLIPPYRGAICTHKDASSSFSHSLHFWWLLADTISPINSTISSIIPLTLSLAIGNALKAASGIKDVAIMMLQLTLAEVFSNTRHSKEEKQAVFCVSCLASLLEFLYWNFFDYISVRPWFQGVEQTRRYPLASC